jgi:hypothetical protein
VNDAQRKTRAWVLGIAAFLFFGNLAHRQLTVKDLAQEASGQKEVPYDASNGERQGVKLISGEIQAVNSFRSRRDAFVKTDTHAHLNAAESMANPTVASQSLKDIANYCAAGEGMRTSVTSTFVQANTNMPMYIFNEFEARAQWCQAETDLYQFVLNPTLDVHIDPADGKLIFPTTADVDAYRVRMKAVKEATDKFMQTDKTFREESAKEMKRDGTTLSDYGFQGNQ